MPGVQRSRRGPLFFLTSRTDGSVACCLLSFALSLPRASHAPVWHPSAGLLSLACSGERDRAEEASLRQYFLCTLLGSLFVMYHLPSLQLLAFFLLHPHPLICSSAHAHLTRNCFASLSIYPLSCVLCFLEIALTIYSFSACFLPDHPLLLPAPSRSRCQTVMQVMLL